MEEEAKKGYRQISKKYALFAVLNTFLNQLQTQGDKYLEEVSWKQCFVLICLNQCEQPPSLKELSEQLGCSHQNTKQMLLKMERLGFVEMKADEHDRRMQRIVMTPKGINVFRDFEKREDTLFSKLYEGVEASDMLMTIRTIQKMESNLKQMDASNAFETGKESSHRKT